MRNTTSHVDNAAIVVYILAPQLDCFAKPEAAPCRDEHERFKLRRLNTQRHLVNLGRRQDNRLTLGLDAHRAAHVSRVRRYQPVTLRRVKDCM
jgi:hypothetical protein